MVVACERIIAFSQGGSDAALMDENMPTRGATLHHLMILGEAARNVPDEWKCRYADIPWARIAGMRDVVAHYYFGIQDLLVIDAVRLHVPSALPQLRQMLACIDGERPPF